MSPLFIDYVTGSSRVRRFYPHSYSLESIAAFARERPRLESSHLQRLCAALAGQQEFWGGESRTVDKLASGAVAVVTGQQPGLFTGPLYTILKAITAIKLARALDENGIPAVPVFWVAAEDHDYEEIHWASVLDRESAVEKVRVDLTNGESSPVGWLRLREDVADAIERCLAGLPQSEFQPAVRAILESAYRPGVSPVEAFARMMARLFKGSELIIADPLQPEIRRLGADVLGQAVRKNAEIRAAVLGRNRALSEAGYHEQVKVDNDFTGLFVYRDRSRVAASPDELRMDAQFSPNVLLRPVVQDSIFPTAAYVGGPAEVAYYGQACPVYEVLGRPVTPVFPRISATVVEARVGRALKRYEIEITDVFRGREFMKRKAVESVKGAEFFDGVRDRITAELESLRPALNIVDPTLGGALETSRQKVLHQVETLRTKYVNAEAKRNEMLEKHLEIIGNSIYPEKKLQERVINVTSFLVRYGVDFVGELERALDLDSREHQVVEI